MLRTLRTRALTFLALLATALALPIAAGAAPAPKVEICHIPPGNPDDFHTIRVSENALAAHLAHGDLGSACGAHCESLCDDTNACTTDACDENEQCVHDAVDCNDGSSCTADSCDPLAGCLNEPLKGDVCLVSDENPCTEPEGTCSAAGACEPTLIEGCCLTDAECDDGNLCDGADFCVDNSCVSGKAVECPAHDACVLSVCLPATGACTQEEVDCDDGDACTVDSCDSGHGCEHARLKNCCLSDADCDDGDSCTQDTCNGNRCENTPTAEHVACFELTGCELDGTGIYEDVDCDDGDHCTADSCDESGACLNEPVGTLPIDEDCSNGIDDDCDGDVDGADSECSVVDCQALLEIQIESCQDCGGLLSCTTEKQAQCELCANWEYEKCIGNSPPNPGGCIELP
jgi:hypothetical protein